MGDNEPQSQHNMYHGGQGERRPYNNNNNYRNNQRGGDRGGRGGNYRSRGTFNQGVDRQGGQRQPYNQGGSQQSQRQAMPPPVMTSNAMFVPVMSGQQQ